MSSKPKKGLFALPFELIKSFIFTLRVFSAFIQEARQVTFSDDEEESIDEQIKLKARKLLQTQVENYGSKVITPHVEGQVKETLNRRFLEFAEAEKNPLMDDKIERLLNQFLKNYDSKRLTRETQERLDTFLNQQITRIATNLETPYPGAVEKVDTLLTDFLAEMGLAKIFTPTAQEIERFVNERIVELAISTDNQQMAGKVQSLTSEFIERLSGSVLTGDTQATINRQINEQGIHWTHSEGAVKVGAKSMALFVEFIESLRTEAIAAHAVDAIKAQVSQKVEEIATTAGNKEVKVQAESLSAKIIEALTETDVHAESTKQVVAHVNQELLKFACEHSNEIIKTRLVGILRELVASMGPHSLYPETENAIKLNLNTRAVDLAQLPDNKDMIRSAETLLKLYLQETNKAEVVNQESMAQIKRALNGVILGLMEQTGKIESEANRVFNEILENCGPQNIDPLVKMKIESVLYQVLVKQLAVYGNKELTNKALELIREVAQSLPHDSSVNDLIMSHKIRQPSTL